MPTNKPKRRDTCQPTENKPDVNQQAWRDFFGEARRLAVIARQRRAGSRAE